MEKETKEQIGKCVAMALIGIITACLLGIGISWGLKSLLVVLPIALVLIFIGVAIHDNYVDKQLSSEQIRDIIIGICIVLFILIGIGSCFHTERHDVLQQRIEMGLPMY